ncbi:MAG: aminotransferase class III-fold pyridoxal phosphate-dependent enzyme [Magnetococcales bacterium]|nr:aminotransferase class III-fold pyridoxal phosphate-dependent enzyme [Magnetococcales bacterium]
MILGILQARFSSTRLPGKVLKPLLNKPMLERQIERVRRARRLDHLLVATSNEPEDDPIARLCQEIGIDCFRGSLNDVLDRFYRAALPHAPEHVVRLTGDCPLAEPFVIDGVVDFHLVGGFDYSSNALEPTFPDGLDVEVIRFAALQEAWKIATSPAEREHVTLHIVRNPERFRHGSVERGEDLSHLRWTVDEPEDFALVERIYEALYPENPAFGMQEILALIDEQPELAVMNTSHRRNEGLERSLQKERYATSEALLQRALTTIPLGSQTFSKSKVQYPHGVSPFFITHGQGSRVWDADGNEYLDFINGLLSISLGYGDPDVNQAVKNQLEKGTLFSLPHPLEMEVAEKIVAMVPGVEQVRFGKNGSDATSGAIRLARAHTGRDHVAVCGYHGWQDWYIGATARHLGVPKATRDLTHTFVYNDITSLEKIFATHPNAVAAVILEPVNVEPPKNGFLEAVRELTRRHGALLVFDETITGFRLANGGAVEYFGVIPDLVTLGKGLANGFPISAIAGPRELMRLMEEIFFSFTFGGETLSLAAAAATLDKLRREPVVATLWEQGRQLLDGLQPLLTRHGVGHFLGTAGLPVWSFLMFKDAGGYGQFEIKSLFLQEIFARGILCIGTHNLSYAHTRADIDTLLAVYDEVLPILKEAVDGGTMQERLRCQPIQPLFKVRG